MKKNLQTVQAVFLVVAMVIGLGVAQAGVVNPITDHEDIESLCAAQPSVAISEAPEGAGDVYYSSIEGGVLQIMFTFDEQPFTYRAMAAENAEIADEQEKTLSGVYIDFDEDVDEEDVAEGDKVPFQVPDFGFDYEIEYNKKDGNVVMYWYIPELKTQYSLYSESAGMPDMLVLEVAELLQAGD